jgi:hypothetical protein
LQKNLPGTTRNNAPDGCDNDGISDFEADETAAAMLSCGDRRSILDGVFNSKKESQITEFNGLCIESTVLSFKRDKFDIRTEIRSQGPGYATTTP